MYRRILVPVDGSECSTRAAAHAGALARAFASEVVLLYVRDAASVLRDGVVDAGPLLDDKQREGTEALARAADALGGYACARQMVDGDPVDEIARAASAVDLVVMGCHDRGLVGRLIRGSMTERVLHRVDCPLLVVPCGSPESAANAANAGSGAS